MAVHYTYVDDITIPDDVDLLMGSTFFKTWRVQNTGDVPWGTGFTIRFDKGTSMTAATSYPLPTAQPGETVDISIEMTVPNQVGRFWSDWFLHDAQGNRFGEVIYVRFDAVQAAAFGSGFPDVVYVEDVTIPDGTAIDAGTTFTKIWRVRNTGTAPWTDGFELVHVDGPAMTAQTVQDIPNARVGEVVDIEIQLTAPTQPGNYTTRWRFRNTARTFFGNWVAAVIVSKAATDATATHNQCTVVQDVTIPDDSQITGGTQFTKTWRVRNTGNQAWGDGYTLRFVNGIAMTNTLTVPLPACPPGQEVNISLNLTAPNQAGTHFSDWQCFDAAGNAFAELVWLRIVVPQSATTSVSTGSAASGSGSSGSITVSPPPVEVSVIHYSQRDPRWNQARLGEPGSPHTIGSWGCLMTCMAMFANFKGNNVTPYQFMTLMLQHNGFVNGYYTSWRALQNVYGNIIAEAGQPIQGGNLVGQINAKLDQKIPVMVQVDRNPKNAYTPDETHWVLVLGRKGSNDYWINDPIDLTNQATSLMQRYGRPGQGLQAALVSILPYR